jgi:hypothetical protein
MPVTGNKENDTMSHDPLIQEVLTALDTMPQSVTEWEANFLESLLTQSYPVTTKQRVVLVRMGDHYLDPCLAAELRGQQRLFA